MHIISYLLDIYVAKVMLSLLPAFCICNFTCIGHWLFWYRSGNAYIIRTVFLSVCSVCMWTNTFFLLLWIVASIIFDNGLELHTCHGAWGCMLPAPRSYTVLMFLGMLFLSWGFPFSRNVFRKWHSHNIYFNSVLSCEMQSRCNVRITISELIEIISRRDILYSSHVLLLNCLL